MFSINLAKNIMAHLVLNQDNFKAEVLDYKGVVLVDFWAAWCGPCQMLGPVIEELGDHFEGKAKVGKVNVDENSELSGQYGIMSIPNVIIFKDGKVVENLVGLQDKQSYIDLVQKYLV